MSAPGRPTSLGTNTAHLSFSQLEDLWTSNGGNPLAAPNMAAIAIAESGGRVNNLNDNPGTGDYSVGLWQINYLGSLMPGRSASYGTPEQLAADPTRQARAAIAISGNGHNLQPWTTWTKGSAQKVLAAQGGPLGAIPATAPLAVNPTLVAVGGGGDAPDIEGYLIDWDLSVSPPGSGLPLVGSLVPKIPGPQIKLSRRAVRNAIGGLVMVGGAVLALAGVFLLRGGKAPGVSGIVQARLRRQTAQTTQEGLLQRQESRQQSSRARSAADSPAGRYGSARAAGEQAADEAGEF